MVHTLKGGYHLEDVRRWEDNIKVVIKDVDCRVKSGGRFL